MTPAVSLLERLERLLGQTLHLETTLVGVGVRVGVVLGTVLMGWVAYRVLNGVMLRVLRPLEDAPDAARAQRARTLAPLLSSVTRYVVAFLVGVIVLQQLGVDVQALLVSAGVIGLAVTLGAQSLIKDVITGVFILFENLIAVGDTIEVGPHSGEVESVGLRVTKLRKFSGELRIIPNGELTAFGHHTAGWTRAVVEVSIAPEQEVGRALAVLDSVGRVLREAHPAEVLESPVAEGIVRLGNADVVLRLHAKVGASHKGALELELRRRIKEALDAERILTPVSRMIVQMAADTRPNPGESERKEPAA